MFEQDLYMNSGTRMFTFAMMGNELVAVIYDARWFLATILLCVLADFRYGWGIREVGYVLATVGICTAIVQAGLIGRIVKAVGERRALLIGQAAGLAGFLLYAFAGQGWLFLVGIPVMAFWGLANPAVQALATRDVDPSEQGRLQGAFMSLASLCGVFAPLMYAGVFAWSIAPGGGWHFAGAPFLLAGVIVALAAVVSERATRAHRRV